MASTGATSRDQSARSTGISGTARRLTSETNTVVRVNVRRLVPTVRQSMRAPRYGRTAGSRCEEITRSTYTAEGKRAAAVPELGRRPGSGACVGGRADVSVPAT